MNWTGCAAAASGDGSPFARWSHAHCAVPMHVESEKKEEIGSSSIDIRSFAFVAIASCTRW